MSSSQKQIILGILFTLFADQQVLALIAQLAKLGRFEVAANFFPRLFIRITGSLPSGGL